MINIDDFIKRFEIILDYYGLNASLFAEKIGVQRSSLSHLLSGRNKPSLDFILKIIEVYPEVDLYWLLNGSGSFPKSNEAIENKTNITSKLFSDEDLFSNLPPPLLEKDESFFKKESLDEISKDVKKVLTHNEIEKIVFFYTDGTFKEYNK